MKFTLHMAGFLVIGAASAVAGIHLTSATFWLFMLGAMLISFSGEFK